MGFWNARPASPKARRPRLPPCAKRPSVPCTIYTLLSLRLGCPETRPGFRGYLSLPTVPQAPLKSTSRQIYRPEWTIRTGPKYHASPGAGCASATPRSGVESISPSGVSTATCAP